MSFKIKTIIFNLYDMFRLLISHRQTTSFSMVSMDRRRTKCVRLVVEPDSTLARDILVAPIRFVIDMNKLHFPGIERLSQWKLKGE